VRDVRNVHALEKKRMLKLLGCSVARRVRSPISNLPFSAILLMIWLIAPVLSPADSVGSNQRTVTKLDENIYVILHQDAPDHFPQSHSVVVIGDSGMLVVDSCYLPSSAREDIAQIRKWTNKPVRYLLNTHWHNDHIQGNSAYADAFPGVTIIAQTETANLMALRVASYLTDYPHRMERFQQQLDSGKDLSGKPLTEEQKQDLKNAVAGGKAASGAVSAEFRGLKAKAPDLTFDHELDLDLGNRKVQLKFLGRGNTTG
jgi:cyclase